MTSTPSPNLSAIAGATQSSWRGFLDHYESLRPELYRYCRYLTRSPWDAEDLVQDALARAFATLATMGEAPANPRAWLFRVASNLWIDRARRQRDELVGAPVSAVESEPRSAREAAGTLLTRLSPQERAAVVLKDVFELSLEEIAEALATSVGAIKAALHRGRGKLVEAPAPAAEAVPAPGVLDAFCDAFNARDLDRLTSLLLDTASIEVVGVHTEYGPDRARNGVFPGMLFGSKRMARADVQGGIEPSFVQGVLPTPPRAEVRVLRGQALLLSWYAHADGEFVRAVTRLESDAEGVTRVQNYFFTPEFIAEVCTELGVPFRVNGYRSCR